MENMVESLQSFYYKKRVLVTGHTGFKGSWLCHILTGMGAQITGYALPPQSDAALFSIAGLEARIDNHIGDIRDMEHLLRVFKSVKPQIVLHLAAQPIVRDSYERPRYTYETNVMGTVNIMECIRLCDSVQSMLNVTTDKVYQNHEQSRGYHETDMLNGHDPYSNSKSCSELVTSGYKNSFFGKGSRTAISTARAGNVIGGGDFAADRIVPDCVRAAASGKPVQVRNPNSLRPYQHVLEPLFAYLQIVKAQSENRNLEGSYNVGPRESDCITTGQLAQLFCDMWGEGQRWEAGDPNGPFEATFLKLDCSHIQKTLGWTPRWDVRTAVQQTVEWYRSWLEQGDIIADMNREIALYLSAGNEEK